jgi:hypothetical protein
MSLDPQSMLKDLEKLDRLRQRISMVEEVLAPIMEETAQEVAEKAALNIHRRTGRTESMISVKYRPLRVVSDAPWSQALEKGSRPHIIYARNRKALHFMGGVISHESLKVGRFTLSGFKAGREGVFASHVHHPGTSGTYFMRRALEDVMPLTMRRLEAGLAALLREE